VILLCCSCSCQLVLVCRFYLAKTAELKYKHYCIGSTIYISYCSCIFGHCLNLVNLSLARYKKRYLIYILTKLTCTLATVTLSIGRYSSFVVCIYVIKVCMYLCDQWLFNTIALVWNVQELVCSIETAYRVPILVDVRFVSC